MAILSPRLWCVAMALLLWAPHTHCREFTHEDIREAFISLVHTIRGTEDKLERHEFREKALGEHIKRMLGGLDKKYRALEPLKGMISRLDERLSNVETILLQKEEREKSSQQKTQETLEDIKKTLQLLTAERHPTDLDNNLSPGGDVLQTQLEVTDAKLESLKKEIKSLKDSLSPDSLRAMCLMVASDMNPFENHISEAEKLLNKYELKLNEYNGTANKVQTDFVLSEVALADDAWHNKMTEVMERQEKDVKKIQLLLSDAESMWKDLPRLADLHRSTNQTIEAIANTNENITRNNEVGVNKMENKLKEMGDRLLTTNKDIQNSLTQGNTMTEQAYNAISGSYEALRNEVQTLSKSDDLIQSTADNVVATKKRVEYGVQQILMQVADQIKSQQRTMNNTVSARLDMIKSTIMQNQTTELGHLGTKIESEMAQVWRQIGIMHQQIMDSRQALSSLSNNTEQYINGSTTTMNKMKKDVEGIDSKLFKLTDDFNFVVGKLSVMTQEFKSMAAELTKSLENTNKDNKAATPKTEDAGPGPHNITSEDTDAK